MIKPSTRDKNHHDSSCHQNHDSPGKSAYEIAVEQGFIGSEIEWIQYQESVNAELSKTQANRSEAEADRAETEANNAEASAAAALLSEGQAASHEDAAGLAALAAEQSKIIAAGHEQVTTTKAAEAQASASAAADSETKTAASESASALSELNSKASEDAAKVSETNAGLSAGTATTEAARAKDEANRAQGYANILDSNLAESTAQADRATTEADRSANEATNSENAATASALSRDASADSANLAGQRATSADLSAIAADASETAALDSENKAKEWATKNRNEEVETGLYSSKHYSLEARDSETAANSAEQNAGISADHAEQMAADAEADKLAAQSHRDSAGVQASNASDSADLSNARATDSDLSAQASAASATESKDARDAAALSETNSAASEVAALGYKNDAAASEDNTALLEASASASELAASGHAADASDFADTALSHANTADSHRSAAALSETNASTSATTATNEADRSTAQANRSETEANRAADYADTMAGGLAFLGQWDASSNTLPSPPSVGSAQWKISAPGTLDGNPVDEGDTLIYDVNSSTFMYLDTKDKIVSVNGRIGSVTGLAEDSDLATVAKSGAYSDLSGLPALAISNWNTAYGWGNHSTVGYAMSNVAINAGPGITGGGDLTGSRTIELGTPSTVTTGSTNSVTAGSHTHALSLPASAVRGEITSINLEDGTSSTLGFISGRRLQAALSAYSDAFNASGYNKTNWDTAYQWGDHSTEGYLKSVTWNDVDNKPNTATRWPLWTEVSSKPDTFTPSTHSHSYGDLPFSSGDVSNWNTAHGWGNHASAGYASQNRSITAGDGLNGGGTLVSNRTLTVDSSVVRTSGDQSITGQKTFNASDSLRYENTSNGRQTFDGTDNGIEILMGSANTTSKYTPAIKFGSTDVNLGTLNPRFGAAIIAEAQQTFSADDTGAMGLSFWTTPAGTPSTEHGLVERLTINSNGNIRAQSGATFFGDGSGLTNLSSSALDGTIAYTNLPFSSSDVSNWNTAYNWGNHADAGYFPTTATTSFSRDRLAESSATAWKNALSLDNVPNVDATDASNLSSGTLPSARLPTITTSMTNFTNQNLNTNSNVNFNEVLINGQITASSAQLQVNGFMRTGNIYLHEGGTTPTSNDGILSNVDGGLLWRDQKVYHEGNKPTAADVGLGSVPNLDARDPSNWDSDGLGGLGYGGSGTGVGAWGVNSQTQFVASAEGAPANGFHYGFKYQANSTTIGIEFAGRNDIYWKSEAGDGQWHKNWDDINLPEPATQNGSNTFSSIQEFDNRIRMNYGMNDGVSYANAHIRCLPSNRVDTTGRTTIALGTSDVSGWGFTLNAHRYANSGAAPRFHINRHDSNNAGTEVFSLENNGDLINAGDITAFSDKRVKENINVIQKALTKVSQLRGVNFNRTDISDKSLRMGLIAQEVQKIVPEVVKGGPTEKDPDALYSVSYGNLVGLLVEALKEEKSEREKLEARLDKLERLLGA